MLFIFKIAEKLGQTVEWTLNNVSTIELEGWAKYYEYIHNSQKTQRKYKENCNSKILDLPQDVFLKGV